MKEQVLLVEDSLFICKTVQRSLQRQVDMDVVTAHSLEEAMALVEDEHSHFFVALLDLNLPDAPNGEIVDYISMHEIPFIVFTSNESSSTKTICEKRSSPKPAVNSLSVSSGVVI